MSDLRTFTPVEPNVARKSLIAVQTAITRIKETVVASVANGADKDELTRRLNKIIGEYCKGIDNEALREQSRKALVTAAKKWFYTTTRTFETVNRNLLSLSGNIYRVGLGGDSKSYFNDVRPMHDRGINIGKPLIDDYKRSVRLAMKALAADPPLVVTRHDGTTYTMPIRNRAETAVRYEANVADLQKFASSGVDLVWTSQHPNCSPRCKDYQGKLWSISGKSGKINGIPYRPLSEALKGKKDDGNGIITGYNCRHRLIEYKDGSRPPQELSEAQIKKEYAIDKKQRQYENNIRRMKTEERLARSIGDTEHAKALRKRWRRTTLEYQAYSFKNGRAYFSYRCTIDETERKDVDFSAERLPNDESRDTIDTQAFIPAETIKEAETFAKQFAENVDYKGATNINSLNTVNKTLQRLTTEFPIDKLQNITVKKIPSEKGKKIAAQANSGEIDIDINFLNSPGRIDWQARISKYPEQIKIIQEQIKQIENGASYKMYKKWLKDAKAFINTAKEEMKYKRHGVCDAATDPLSAVIMHEYGHVLARQRFGLGTYQSSYEIGFRAETSRRLVRDTYQKAKDTGDIYSISKYASEKVGEFYAECFAAHMIGEKLPGYIEEMLKETLKKK